MGRPLRAGPCVPSNRRRIAENLRCFSVAGFPHPPGDCRVHAQRVRLGCRRLQCGRATPNARLAGRKQSVKMRGWTHGIWHLADFAGKAVRDTRYAGIGLLARLERPISVGRRGGQTGDLTPKHVGSCAARARSPNETLCLTRQVPLPPDQTISVNRSDAFSGAQPLNIHWCRASSIFR